MKKLFFILLMVFIFSISAYAQTGKSCQQEQGQGMSTDQGQMSKMQCPKMQQMSGQGMMQGGHQMPMMQMGMPMMQQMMGHGMMMQDMMQIMTDIMNMQEKIITGVKASEKKELLDRIKDMKTRMQNRMSMQQCVMGGMAGGMMGEMMGQPSDVSQCRLSCAKRWLKEAIDLHEVHLKDPKTATESSQMEMMDQMKKAYECIAGVCCGMSGTPLKEPGSKETEEGKTPKGDVHGH